MGRFVKGDVVVLVYPFSNLQVGKRRPALVLASSGNDVVLCQITSQQRSEWTVEVGQSDFENGNLNQISSIRADRLLSVDQSIILYRLGRIKPDKQKAVVKMINQLLERGG